MMFDFLTHVLFWRGENTYVSRFFKSYFCSVFFLQKCIYLTRDYCPPCAQATGAGHLDGARLYAPGASTQSLYRGDPWRCLSFFERSVDPNSLGYILFFGSKDPPNIFWWILAMRLSPAPLCVGWPCVFFFDSGDQTPPRVGVHQQRPCPQWCSEPSRSRMCVLFIIPFLNVPLQPHTRVLIRAVVSQFGGGGCALIWIPFTLTD